MATLSDFCMNGYSGAGYLTMAFVCELHKGLFAPDFTFRQEVDGKGNEVVPGKYRKGKEPSTAPFSQERRWPSRRQKMFCRNGRCRSEAERRPGGRRQRKS